MSLFISDSIIPEYFGLEDEGDQKNLEVELLSEDDVKSLVAQYFNSNDIFARVRTLRMATLLSGHLGIPLSATTNNNPLPSGAEMLIIRYDGPVLGQDSDGNFPGVLPKGGKLNYYRLKV